MTGFSLVFLLVEFIRQNEVFTRYPDEWAKFGAG